MMRSVQPSGPFGRLLALAAGAILLILGFMFSVVVLAVAAVAGLGLWAYLWWKTRALRKAMGERPPPGGGDFIDGEIIDGEAVVVEEPPAGQPPILPRDRSGD